MKDAKNLDNLRDKIDAIDSELIALLDKRTEVVLEVGKTKEKTNAEFYAPDRERAVYRRIEELSKGLFPKKALRSIYREIMSASLSLEKPLRIAFLGPNATFTHLASMKHFGLSGEFIPKEEISSVFNDVERGKAEYGVVPIESTAEGVVNHTLDMFINSELKISAEILLEATTLLLNKSGNIKDIEKVCSNPHAIAQCVQWLKINMPNIPIVEVVSTATAAEMAKNDPSVGAVASEAAATFYDLKIVEDTIQDNPYNMTRFLVIGKKESTKTGADKTSLMFAIKDSPGALYKFLKPFASRGINLTKIESRPLKQKAWEYVFFLDIDGHKSEENISDAIGELDEMASFMKVLGSYTKSK
ncbi:MAG: prephenate dehydratase [Deltaproteobacteria bacterium]|nr:prephenate dehydratase [Deltaproteobacteria bacterium]